MLETSSQGLIRCRRPRGGQEIGERHYILPGTEGAFGTQGRAPTGGCRRGLLAAEFAFGAPGGKTQCPPPSLKYAPVHDLWRPIR